MNLGERIREARLSKGLTIQDVANKLGVSYQNISQYERGIRNPKPATLQKIAAALGVPVSRLVGVTFPDRLLAILSYRTNLSLAHIAEAAHVTEEDINRMTAGDLEPSPETFKALARVLNVTEDCLAGRTEADIVEPAAEQRPLPRNAYSMDQLTGQPVRVLGKAAAGEPIYAPEDYDVYVNSPVKCDAAIEVQGDSMVPDYLDGDMVYIRCCPDVDDGQVAVVFLDDDAVIKEVCHVPDGLLLLSKNKRYKPLHASMDDYPNLRIFGVPVGFTRMYKKDPLQMVRKGFR
jgi:repressor LexA